jgi:hypothetical protein
MKNVSNPDLSLTTSPEENALDLPQPLTPTRRIELWSGRLAMVGFTTTVMAIAFQAGL